MKKKDIKDQVMVYDFTKCQEEVSIGVFVESDLSKTLANYIYQHTTDIESAEFARELFHKGKVEMNDQTRNLMIRNIGDSALLISQKQAILEILKR